MREKKKFCVEGNVKGIGHIEAYTYSYNGARAKLQVIRKLKKEYPDLVIFIKNITAKEISRAA